MQRGDVGATITVTIRQDGAVMDVSSSSARNLIFRAPSGTVSSFAAAFASDGTDGQIVYTTAAAGDINEAGTWDVQAEVTMPAGTFRTNFANFFVGETL